MEGMYHNKKYDALDNNKAAVNTSQWNKYESNIRNCKVVSFLF